MGGIGLVIPTAIIHMFIRAERESDWLLHLHCVQQMLPYFFAAGHSNYARKEDMEHGISLKRKALFLLQPSYIHEQDTKTALRVPSATKVL